MASSAIYLGSRRLVRRARRLSWWARPLPNFLIVGAQKAGTTALFQALKSAPGVCLSLTKEPHFFDKEFEGGVKHYRSFFPIQVLRSKCLAGEATPMYLFDPRVPQRVKEMIPMAKIIVLLRDPADRAISHYYHNINKGRESRPLWEAIDSDVRRFNDAGCTIRVADESEYEFQHYSYYRRGIYSLQLQEWLKCFAMEQILILPSAQLQTHSNEVYARIKHFLSIDMQWEPESVRANIGVYDRVDSEDRGALVGLYEEERRRLKRVIDWDAW